MSFVSMDNYRLECNNYGSNFAKNLNELRQENELIDVVLVVDNHLFNVHRLVLSAFSLYFRQMFRQMPANQQAYVFLKDISRQIMQDLITFIYTGQVSVSQELLSEFFQTADALKINGLAANNNNPLQTEINNQMLTTKSTFNEPKHIGQQYQTTQINQMHSLAMLCHRNDENSISDLPYFDQNILDDIEEHLFGADNINNDRNNISYDSDIDEIIATVNNDDIKEWNFDDIIEETTPFDVPNEPIAKRSRAIKSRSDSDYNIFADIRSIDGHEYLMYENYKFGRHGRMMNELEQRQRWRCTRNRTSKCRAAVSTISVKLIELIDGKQLEKDAYLMKILNANHSHEI